MTIQFIREHGPHQIGRVFDHPHVGVAVELVRRGIAVEYKPEPSTGDSDDDSDEERARKRRRRGRAV